MFIFGIIGVAFLTAVGAATGVGTWAAYRSFQTSVLDDFMGDRQLVHLLRKKNLLNDFAHGNIHCVICDDVLDMENLRLVIRDGSQMKFGCGRLSCSSQLVADRARLLDNLSVAG